MNRERCPCRCMERLWSGLRGSGRGTYGGQGSQLQPVDTSEKWPLVVENAGEKNRVLFLHLNLELCFFRIACSKEKITEEIAAGAEAPVEMAGWRLQSPQLVISFKRHLWYLKMDGLFQGKSQLEMDDLGVPPWLRKPPYGDSKFQRSPRALFRSQKHHQPWQLRLRRGITWPIQNGNQLAVDCRMQEESPNLQTLQDGHGHPWFSHALHIFWVANLEDSPFWTTFGDPHAAFSNRCWKAMKPLPHGSQKYATHVEPKPWLCPILPKSWYVMPDSQDIVPFRGFGRSPTTVSMLRKWPRLLRRWGINGDIDGKDLEIPAICIWLVVWNILYFPISWVANHPNWLSYFSEGWPNHQPGMAFPFGEITAAWKISTTNCVGQKNWNPRLATVDLKIGWST